MKRICFFFFCAICLAVGLPGCAYLSNREGLMTLKEFSDNQKEIDNYLTRQERLFYKLKNDLNKVRLEGMAKEKVIKIYGDPIFCQPLPDKNNAGEQCLYRHPTDFFGSDMIYLEFDSNQKLKSWYLIKQVK